jgi:lysine 2,3-aminomutase
LAGGRDGVFRELISPFLQAQMVETQARFGAASSEHRALALQYVKDHREDKIDVRLERRRHYEAEIFKDDAGQPLVGVERLYRRTALIEPSTVCAAHCRWCLRGQYPVKTLTADEVTRAAKYFGSAHVRDDLREVLITGGDPFMVRVLLEFTIDQIAAHAPNIEIIRIGTRVPVQDPARVNDALLGALTKHPALRVEIGTHINHPIELSAPTEESFKKLADRGMRIYNQHPLLRGVNDDLDTLVELYDRLRQLGIEAHYLFHCIPMRGMEHHRTSVLRGLELVRQLVSSGGFSGRTKPEFAAMTDIGKVTLYEGTIVGHRNGELLIQTGYRLDDRLRWNPSWQRPDSCAVDENGCMRVWYLDGPSQ